jgi:hypothetical protein
MSVQTIAAIYGGVAGAIVSGIFGLATLFISRAMRRRGGVRFTPPDDWRFAVFEWASLRRGVTPSRSVRQEASYRRVDLGGRLDRANCFAYAFTAAFLNRMDVGAALSDVRVALMKNGTEMFSHGPFDEEDAVGEQAVLDRHVGSFEDDVGDYFSGGWGDDVGERY